jgi:hypothetical protein
MARRMLAIALGALSCFTDPPSLDDDDGTTGGACAVGSEGCFCTDGGSCDAGLECIEPAGVCIAIGCTPGTALCECAQELCENGYECVQNFCAPQGGGTVTLGTSDSDDVGGTGSPSTSHGPATDTSVDTASGPPDTGSNEVSTDPTTDSMGSTTGTPPTCAECLGDVRLAECNPEWVKCNGCLLVYDCFEMGMSPKECCVDPMPLDWQAFGLCADDYCAASCGSVSCL